MPILKSFIPALLTAYFFMWPALSFADEPDSVLSFQFENDFFGGGTDRHFSHGTRIEYYTGSINWIAKWADKLPWFDSEKDKDKPDNALEGRASISIGQNIYTPENTFTPNPVSNERPYAGWLYVGFGLMANQGINRYDKLQLEIGIVGPASLARDVQTFWHSLFGLHVPEGWDHQLKNEPGVVLHYEQAYRIYEKPGEIFILEYDMVPHIGGSVGNVYTYGSIGYTVRLGQGLKKDFGAPRIQPSLPGGGYFRGGGLNWYLFAGMQGRLVLRNIFLDGNTFTESPSVEKKYLVGDLQAGITFRWKRVRMSYTQIIRTREFEGQDRDDILGSLSISFQF
jgi:lipid A 3-O-deacylase